MKAPQQAVAPGHGYINTHLMRGQQCEDTMKLWCPGGQDSEELDTDSSWEKGDLVTSVCVCSCPLTAVQSKVKGAPPWVGGCPSQEAEKVRSALQSPEKLVLSACGLAVRFYCRDRNTRASPEMHSKVRLGVAIDLLENKPQTCPPLRFSVHLEPLGGWGVIQREMFSYCSH